MATWKKSTVDTKIIKRKESKHITTHKKITKENSKRKEQKSCKTETNYQNSNSK